MTPDIQILSVVQIALIGILVVLGMFFLWRKIQRLEAKVEALGGQLSHCMGGGAGVEPERKAASIYAAGAGAGAGYEDEDADADYEDEDADADAAMFGLNDNEEAIVQRILQGSMDDGSNGGGGAAFMFFSPFAGGMGTPGTSSVPVVHIEDADVGGADGANGAGGVGAGDEGADESGSEAPTQTTMTLRPASRSRLARMNVEQLKGYLAQHQLSTEGTKKQLLERAMETILTV